MFSDEGEEKELTEDAISEIADDVDVEEAAVEEFDEFGGGLEEDRGL